jgi:hypothetical protein
VNPLTMLFDQLNHPNHIIHVVRRKYRLAEWEASAPWKPRVAAGRLGASGGWRLAAWLALEWLPFAIAPSKCMMWFRRVVRYGT